MGSTASNRFLAVLGERTRVATALESAHALARSTVDPALLDLAERRVAQLLRIDQPGAAIGDRDTGQSSAAAPEPGLGDSILEQQVLAFVEQWVIDVASLTDAMVNDLIDTLGEDAFVDFLHALLVVEQRLRLALAWERLGLAS